MEPADHARSTAWSAIACSSEIAQASPLRASSPRDSSTLSSTHGLPDRLWLLDRTADLSRLQRFIQRNAPNTLPGKTSVFRAKELASDLPPARPKLLSAGRPRWGAACGIGRSAHRARPTDVLRFPAKSRRGLCEVETALPTLYPFRACRSAGRKSSVPSVVSTGSYCAVPCGPSRSKPEWDGSSGGGRCCSSTSTAMAERGGRPPSLRLDIFDLWRLSCRMHREAIGSDRRENSRGLMRSSEPLRGELRIPWALAVAAIAGKIQPVFHDLRGLGSGRQGRCAMSAVSDGAAGQRRWERFHVKR